MYYSQAMQDAQGYTEVFYFNWNPANVEPVRQYFVNTPVLSASNGNNPTQDEIDDFLGVPGDLPATFMNSSAVGANAISFLINMNGQAREGQNPPFLLGGVMGVLRANLLNNAGGVSEGLPTKDAVVYTISTCSPNAPVTGSYVTPAGNILVTFQLNNYTWGISAQSFDANAGGTLRLEVQWFPK